MCGNETKFLGKEDLAEDSGSVVLSIIKGKGFEIGPGTVRNEPISGLMLMAIAKPTRT